MTRKFQINTDEPFPHLEFAPIVEAIIDLKASATLPLDEKTLRALLEKDLEGYLFLDSRKQYQQTFEVKSDGPQAHELQDLGWLGVRFRSTDKLQIASFGPAGFSFSRLEPYNNWSDFSAEALRLWRKYLDYAAPVEIARIGVRFINRIRMPNPATSLDEYTSQSPRPIKSFPNSVSNFFHQERLSVADYPYMIGFTKTLQPIASDSIGVILDVDVMTTEPMEINDTILDKRLKEMRWLKNKVFFESVTDRALTTMKA